MKHLAPCLLAAFLLLAAVRSSQADATARYVYQTASTSTVLIKGTNKTGWCKGTGFVYQTPNGPVIITAKHVVSETCYNYTVTTPTGQVLRLATVFLSPRTDLAVLTVSGTMTGVPGLKIATKDAQIGDDVYSVGYPETHTNLVLGVGLVSQYCDALVPGSHLMGCCQINPGNSGGPLLNSAGEVIAITDCSESDAANLCYGLPVSMIQAALSLYARPTINLAQYLPRVQVPQKESASAELFGNWNKRGLTGFTLKQSFNGNALCLYYTFKQQKIYFTYTRFW